MKDPLPLSLSFSLSFFPLPITFSLSLPFLSLPEAACLLLTLLSPILGAGRKDSRELSSGLFSAGLGGSGLELSDVLGPSGLGGQKQSWNGKGFLTALHCGSRKEAGLPGFFGLGVGMSRERCDLAAGFAGLGCG